MKKAIAFLLIFVFILTLFSGCKAESPLLHEEFFGPFPNAKTKYRYAVNWCCEKGYLSGFSEYDFGADQPVTKTDAAIALYRMSGSPDVFLWPFSSRTEQEAEAVKAVKWCEKELFPSCFSKASQWDTPLTHDVLAVCARRYAEYQQVEIPECSFPEEDAVFQDADYRTIGQDTLDPEILEAGIWYTKTRIGELMDSSPQLIIKPVLRDEFAHFLKLLSMESAEKPAFQIDPEKIEKISISVLSSKFPDIQSEAMYLEEVFSTDDPLILELLHRLNSFPVWEQINLSEQQVPLPGDASFSVRIGEPGNGDHCYFSISEHGSVSTSPLSSCLSEEFFVDSQHTCLYASHPGYFSADLIDAFYQALKEAHLRKAESPVS